MKKKTLKRKIFLVLLTGILAINLIFSDIIFSQSIDCGFTPNEEELSYSGPFRGLYKPLRSDLSGDASAPSQAYFPVLILFVQFKNDADFDWWHTNQAPQYLDSMISPIKKTNTEWWNAYDENKEMVSDYWMEISQGKMHVCGHAYSIILDSTSSYYQTLGATTAERTINAEIWKKLNSPSIGINWQEYDKWKDSVINNEHKYFYQPDNTVDFIYKVHKTTGGILCNRDGYAYLGVYNQGIRCEVDTANHIYVDYGFSSKGSGATVCKHAEKKRIFFAMGHEHGHFLYANGHITYGKDAYGPGSEINFSPYEQVLLGYAKYSTANLNNQNTYTIGDYSGRDTTYDQFLLVPINSAESFAIANRNNLSRWDRVMIGDTARILLTDLNSDYGKGAYIYHFNKQPVLPSSDENVQDLECADGFWHWSYIGLGHYYAYDRGFCWDGGITDGWKIFKRDSVIYDNDNGWNNSSNYFGDDKSFFHPIRFGVGEANQDPCKIGSDRINTNVEESFPFEPGAGDRWDPWNREYNEMFSPYSSPSTNTMSNSNSGIFIYLSDNNDNNHTKTFNIYRVGYNGMALDSILKLTPPSRPMGLTISLTECNNWVMYPQITWNHNMEPDMRKSIRGIYNKRYKIYRAYIYYDEVPVNYVEIADRYFPESTNPVYVDYNVIDSCFDSDQEHYRIRYEVKAVDNTNWASVYSDFVSIPSKSVIAPDFSVSTNGGSDLPKSFALSQNFPNPFNPVTKINYDLPNDVFVSIKIYDVLGREIKTLVNEFKNSGRYMVSFNGSEFASGVYFYRIKAGSFNSIKRMLLIK
jgi:hypothetical protein